MLGIQTKQTHLWSEQVNLFRRIEEDHILKKIHRVSGPGFRGRGSAWRRMSAAGRERLRAAMKARCAARRKAAASASRRLRLPLTQIAVEGAFSVRKPTPARRGPSLPSKTSDGTDFLHRRPVQLPVRATPFSDQRGIPGTIEAVALNSSMANGVA
jgi:hypothetical protein